MNLKARLPTPFRRALKLLGLLAAVVALLLVGLVVAIRIFFPNEAVRQELERRLSETLQATVRIASLEFDPLSGLEARRVEVAKGGARLAALDQLTLRYDPWHLLHGELVITELALRRAKVSIDLEGPPAVAPAPEPPPPAPPTELPVLPLAIDLQSLTVQESDVTIQRGRTLRLALNGLGLQSRLSAGPRTASAAGSVDVARLGLVVDDRSIQLPVKVEFELDADLATQRLEIKQLAIQSEPALRLSCTGEVASWFASPELALSLRESTIALRPMLRLVKDFFPPTLVAAEIAGTLSPDLRVTGRLGEQGFDGTVSVQLEGSQVQGALPALRVSFEPTSVALEAREIPIRANVPETVRAELSVRSGGAMVQEQRLRQIGLQLTAARETSGDVSVRLGVKAQVTAQVPPGMMVQPQAVELDVEATGNAGTRTISLEHATARLGQLIRLEAQGDLEAPPGTGGDRPFALNVALAADVAKILPALPREMLGAMAVTKRGQPDALTLAVRGRLDQALRLRQAELDGSLTVSGLAASLESLGLGATLAGMQVAMQGAYRAERQQVDGRVTGTVRLAKLAHGASTAIGNVRVSVESALTGRLSADGRPTTLRSRISLALLADRLRYGNGGIHAQLPRMTVTAKAKADLLAGAYRLDALRIASGSLFELLAAGDFRSQERRFAAEVSLPALEVGGLLKHLRGPALETVADIDPSGRVALRLRGFGRLPGPGQARAFEIPVTALGTLELDDVSGAFGDRAVKGARGRVRLSFDPAKRQRVETSWHVLARQVSLGEGLPVREARDVSLDVEATAEGFDSVEIGQLRVGMDGAELSFEGVLSGLRQLFDRGDRPLLTRVGPVFAKVRSTAELELDRFEEVARRYGLQATGRVALALGVLKKVRGPVEVRVRAVPAQVSLSSDGARIVELDGSLAFRKALRWRPGSGPGPGTEPGFDGADQDVEFSPLALLPELRSSTPPREDLRAKLVDLGAVQLTDVAAGLTFDRDRLVIQDLALNVLGGGLGGNVVLTAGKAVTLTSRLEVAELDLNQLLPPADRIQGDSLLDGTLNVTAVVEPSEGRLDVGRSRLELSLSRIGRDALDQLLRGLDPTGSNPSVVGARSAVRLANPSEVRVTLLRGLLGLRIGFQEGLLSRFEMDRIPVSQVKPLQRATQALPQWSALRRILEALGAERYGVDQDGRLVLE